MAKPDAGSATYVYPNCTAVVRHDGGRMRLHPAQRWLSTDPFVLARPDLFTAAPLITSEAPRPSTAEEQANSALATREREARTATIPDASRRRGRSWL